MSARKHAQAVVEQAPLVKSIVDALIEEADARWYDRFLPWLARRRAEKRRREMELFERQLDEWAQQLCDDELADNEDMNTNGRCP